MNEIKSYEITLSRRDRFSLYASGALSWSQIFTKEPFYIKKNEIQWLIDLKATNQFFFCAFERDKQLHQVRLDKITYASLLKENELSTHTTRTALRATSLKTLKYLKTIPIFLLASIILSSLFSDLVPSLSTFKSLFLSTSCDSYCAVLIGSLSSTFLMVFSFAFSYPIFYFLLRHLFLKKFEFKPGRPFVETIIFTMTLFAFSLVLIPTYSDPRVAHALIHWKNGTLNKETIAQIRSEFEKKTSHERTTATQSSVETE